MRKIKKYFYGFLLTTFVVIGSVNVFALDLGDVGQTAAEAGANVSDGLKCQYPCLTIILLGKDFLFPANICHYTYKK